MLFVKLIKKKFSDALTISLNIYPPNDILKNLQIHCKTNATFYVNKTTYEGESIKTSLTYFWVRSISSFSM